MSLRRRLVLLVVAAVLAPVVTIALALVVTNDSLSSTSTISIGVGTIAVAALAAWLLGRTVERWITQPVARLRDVASELASGDLATFDIAVPEGGPELDELSSAFSGLIANIRRTVDELTESRRELRLAIERVGAALEATHDRQSIVEVLLDTAALTVGAKASVFWLWRAGGLEVVAADGATERGTRMRRGEGLAGAAAKEMSVAVVPAGPELSEAEPVAEAALAVPVRSSDRLYGVLAVYGRADGEPFTAEDADTLTVLARQAEVAIHNTFLHDEASRLSITDGLTGLWNRRQFDFSINQEIDRSTRFGEPFSVVMLDLDDFKQVNDAHGHQVGDAVLIELARRLTDATREVDLVARYGGEEFVLLLPKTSLEGASQLAEKVRSSVAALPFVIDDLSLPLTLSAGVASYPDDGTGARRLVGAADAALYRAKALGKDRVVAAAQIGSEPERTGGVAASELEIGKERS